MRTWGWKEHSQYASEKQVRGRRNKEISEEEAGYNYTLTFELAHLRKTKQKLIEHLARRHLLERVFSINPFLGRAELCLVYSVPQRRKRWFCFSVMSLFVAVCLFAITHATVSSNASLIPSTSAPSFSSSLFLILCTKHTS